MLLLHTLKYFTKRNIFVFGLLIILTTNSAITSFFFSTSVRRFSCHHAFHVLTCLQPVMHQHALFKLSSVINI
ncbi:hypothetical protein CW304_24685 [Bacillus sp. UFRGS-B20]|nr:hypothetical protein CW304_24685 [Bacillus sp. UFRGS-B20]